MGSKDNAKYFLVLDLGTTSTRACVIDKSFSIVGSARFESILIQGEDGSAELDPEPYFKSIVRILREAVSSANIKTIEITSLSISCQRSTFITWDKNTGEHFHNLITWKDRRAAKMVEKVNNSFFLKLIRNGSKILYALTRKEFLMTTSNLKLANTWTNHRLQYFIQNNEKLKNAIKNNHAMYGALDTWLLSKLKKDYTNHVSDITSSAATGMYDVFKLDFSTPLLAYFSIKKSVLPKVVSNFHDFGFTHKDILGEMIRIDVLVSDQSASLIGNCCFKPLSSKITLGTGSFLQLNVGHKCKGSKVGANPLVAWSFANEAKKRSTIFKLELFHESSSDAIKFMQVAGLCSDISQLSDIAQSVDDSGGVFFIPEFYGFKGIKQSTTSYHLVRAVLENIIFTVSHFFFLMKSEETKYRPNTIRIDGGIAKNNFICQSIASLTGVSIERSKDCSEVTSIGCAFLAAFKIGMLESLDEAENYFKSERVFVPDPETYEILMKNYRKYLKIVLNV